MSLLLFRAQRDGSTDKNTVLLKSIRQSRVTGVLDVTNFGTLSHVTEALDEYTFRHGRFKISVQGGSEQVSLAADTLLQFSRHSQGFLSPTSQTLCFRPNLTGKKSIFPCSTTDLLK
jgi:hypothetical protein